MEHELPDRPPCRSHGGEDGRVTVPSRPSGATLLELGPSLVNVHRRPRKVAADVLAAEHRVEEREIARLVRPKGQPGRRDRERGSEHQSTIPGAEAADGTANARAGLGDNPPSQPADRE